MEISKEMIVKQNRVPMWVRIKVKQKKNVMSNKTKQNMCLLEPAKTWSNEYASYLPRKNKLCYFKREVLKHNEMNHKKNMAIFFKHDTSFI